MHRPPKDILYLKERAEQEIRRAESAAHPDAAQAHYQLADYYLDLVYNGSDASSKHLAVQADPAGFGQLRMRPE